MLVEVKKMIKKWVKILPYNLLMFLTRRFSPNFINTTELGVCTAFRIDKGEWILFSKENYDKMEARERKYKETKLEKNKYKILKKINKDYNLKEEIKKELNYEEESEY